MPPLYVIQLLDGRFWGMDGWTVEIASRCIFTFTEAKEFMEDKGNLADELGGRIVHLPDDVP